MTDIETAAETAYLAGMGLRTDKTMRIPPWAELPDHWKRIYRTQAAAVLELTETALF